MMVEFIHDTTSHRWAIRKDGNLLKDKNGSIRSFRLTADERRAYDSVCCASVWAITATDKMLRALAGLTRKGLVKTEQRGSGNGIYYVAI